MAPQDKGTGQEKHGQEKGRPMGGNGGMAGVESTETLVRQIYQLFNDRQFDKLVGLVAEDGRWQNMATGEKFEGRDGVRRHWDSWIAAVPDYKCEITNIVATPDRAVVEYIGRGRHTGILKGMHGAQIPPTNRPLQLSFCESIELRNGRAWQGRLYFDVASMMSQLGVLDIAQLGKK